RLTRTVSRRSGDPVQIRRGEPREAPFRWASEIVSLKSVKRLLKSQQARDLGRGRDGFRGGHVRRLRRENAHGTAGLRADKNVSEVPGTPRVCDRPSLGRPRGAVPAGAL